MPTVEDLASVPLFSSLDEERLKALADWFHVQNAGEGIRLVGEGAPGYTFFVIVDGAATVRTADDRVAELGPGDFFGEMAILGDGRRNATVTSTTPIRLLVMFGTEFRRLEAEYPEIGSRIYQAVEARATEISQPA
jgi:CRP-like cAMP-binding protein